MKAVKLCGLITLILGGVKLYFAMKYAHKISNFSERSKVYILHFTVFFFINFQLE